MSRGARIAVWLVPAGLVASAIGLVRYVAARDLGGAGPSAVWREAPAAAALLAAGPALVGGGLVALAWRSRPALMFLAGLALTGVAGLRYLAADEARRAEQARLDREWAEVNRRAARQFPRVLPGARPFPAPLRGLPLVFGLLAAGGAIGLAGAVLLVTGPGSARGSPNDHQAPTTPPPADG